MEIERKFLVKKLPSLLHYYKRLSIRQGYLSFTPEVRIRAIGNKHVLTVKGEGALSREEFEINISVDTFMELSESIVGNTIQKTRYIIPLPCENIAELDIYKNIKGITYTVEVEFASVEDSNNFKIPDWFGLEITDDMSYKNKNLCRQD